MRQGRDCADGAGERQGSSLGAIQQVAASSRLPNHAGEGPPETRRAVCVCSGSPSPTSPPCAGEGRQPPNPDRSAAEISAAPTSQNPKPSKGAPMTDVSLSQIAEVAAEAARAGGAVLLE